MPKRLLTLHKSNDSESAALESWRKAGFLIAKSVLESDKAPAQEKLDDVAPNELVEKHGRRNRAMA